MTPRKLLGALAMLPYYLAWAVLFALCVGMGGLVIVIRVGDYGWSLSWRIPVILFGVGACLIIAALFIKALVELFEWGRHQWRKDP
jgi:hypothetical protein